MDAASFTFTLLCFAGCLSYGSLSNEEQRVIGGRPTIIQQIPYITSLRINGRHVCGASIINRQWVVTAAHCFTNVTNPIRSTTICRGSSYRKNCIVHTVNNVTTHERFNYTTGNNDIAVVRVISSFKFNSVTQPIALPPSGASNAPSGTICGWGYYRKYPNGTVIKVLSDQLRCAQVPLVNKCQRYISNRVITRQMVCYGYLQGGISTCQGDSGGPLAYGRTLYGITSFSNGCADANSPGVFANLLTLGKWVKQKTGIK